MIVNHVDIRVPRHLDMSSSTLHILILPSMAADILRVATPRSLSHVLTIPHLRLKRGLDTKDSKPLK
jgi:hypothetical protein